MLCRCKKVTFGNRNRAVFVFAILAAVDIDRTGEMFSCNRGKLVVFPDVMPVQKSYIRQSKSKKRRVIQTKNVPVLAVIARRSPRNETAPVGTETIVANVTKHMPRGSVRREARFQVAQ